MARALWGHAPGPDAAGRAADTGPSDHLERPARRVGGRRRRDRPGAAVLWRGLQHLGDLTTMSGMMRRDSPSMHICLQLAAPKAEDWEASGHPPRVPPGMCGTGWTPRREGHTMRVSYFGIK